MTQCKTIYYIHDCFSRDAYCICPVCREGQRVFVCFYSVLSFRVRVCVCKPANCSFQVMWLTLCTALVGYVPDGNFKTWLNHNVSIMCFGILSSALSSVITYHNPENRPKNGICVANHTSPIDVLVLMCDNCYSLVGEAVACFLGRISDFSLFRFAHIIVSLLFLLSASFFHIYNYFLLLLFFWLLLSFLITLNHACGLSLFSHFRFMITNELTSLLFPWIFCMNIDILIDWSKTRRILRNSTEGFSQSFTAYLVREIRSKR